MPLQASLEEAIAWQQRGDASRADAVCQALLQLQPSHADAWHLRGLLACQAGQPERGIELIQQSLRLNPRQPAAHANIGSALQQLNRANEALLQFDAALRLQAGSAATHYGRACALLSLGRAAEALADFDRALAQTPTLLPALNGRGQALHQLRRLDEALACFERALLLAPQSADALFHQGNVLFDLRKFERALASYDSALNAGCRSVAVFNNRGNALRELCRPEAALDSYRQALQIEPAQPESLCNRANALLDLDRLEDALAGYQAVLQLRPGFPEALDNLGLALLMAERPAEAARCYAQLLRVAPDFELAASNVLNARSACCDWTQFADDRAVVVQQVQREDLVHPFVLLAVADEPELQLRCARRFIATRWGPCEAHATRANGYRHQRLKIAYVSGDLREHAVGMSLAGVFECHDPEHIEALEIALRPGDDSPTGRRIRAALTQTIDATRMNDREVADLMRRLEIDVAVDLMGFTRWCRPGIFAHRAAPVQVNYLGYAGTLGAPYMDYVLGDEVVIPAGQERWYAEQVVRLPHCYLPNDDRRPIAPSRPTRAQAGLPREGVVFCAFTNTYKINPPMYEVWMRLLREVAGSVLWLRGVGEVARANLQREAQRRGVAAERLVFAAHVGEMGEHLARQGLADLYLDTLPYNAHSTACDALWAGVPVLTCAGGSFAGRVAASALTALGLPELITHSLQEYESRALQLAREPQRLQGLRERLAQHRLTQPLFDTAGYTRALESAYRHMHQRAARGEPAAGFDVAASAARQGGSQ